MAFIYLVFIVVKLPAGFVATQLQQQIAGLSFSEVHGSLWSGSAGNVHYQRFDLGRMDWSVLPAALFAARWKNAVKFSGSDTLSGHGLYSVSMAGLHQLSETDLQGDLRRIITAIGVETAGLELDGDIGVQIEEAIWQSDESLIAFQGEFQLASLTITEQLLGNFTGTIILSDQGDIVLDFSPQDVNGLGAEGRFIVSADGNAELHLRLSQLDVLNKPTADLLRLFSKEEGGTRVVNWQGKLGIRF